MNGIKKLKYRIYWKSFRITEYRRSPFVFEKRRALKTIKSIQLLEIAEEKALRRPKKSRTEFMILPESEYSPHEIALLPCQQSYPNYQNQLKLLTSKGLI